MAQVRVPCPVAASSDLRSMLRRHLARRSVEALASGAARRRAAIAAPASAAAWAAQVRAGVREILGLEGMRSRSLLARVVSRHEREHHLLENVVFESVEGWQTAASIFWPRGDGPFLPIIVPCGHSGKATQPHQIPPQVFARGGYVAIVFDPPAQGGEKGPGNDHFVDGPRCDAVGQTSQRYFVADALRAMDYLETRPEADTSRGFAMTGVSGGGMTTMWAALADERVKVASAVCCLAPEEEHPIADGYATCPEPIALGMFARGLGTADLLAALAPLPQLCQAGAQDEVFTEAMTRRVTREAEAVYGAIGAADRFELAIEDCGHDYTASMARRFVAFADKHLRGEPGRAHGVALAEDPALEPEEAMACRPAAEPNMRTISLARAQELRQRRGRLSGRADAARAVRSLVPGIEGAQIERVARGWRQASWLSDVEELLLSHEGEVDLPATALWPHTGGASGGAWGGLAVFDDRGRWAPMARSGWVAQASGHLDRGAARGVAVLSVDLRGWGDTAPAPGPYDLAGWSGPERWPSYVSGALGDGLLAQRARDAAATCRWLMAQQGVDPRRMVVAGRGLGGVVALLAAAMIEHVAGVVCIDTPASIEAVVGEPRYGWGVDVFMPRMLEFLDLEPLAEALAPVLWVRPRDAQGRALREESDGVATAWVQRLMER